MPPHGLHKPSLLPQLRRDRPFGPALEPSNLRTSTPRTLELSNLDPSSPVRDWRVANADERMEIVAFDLPVHLEQLCVQHVRKMGLVFGAIDLVLDKQGIFWFIENNPDGAWAFIEKVTGQPIGKAVADLLVTGG